MEQHPVPQNVTTFQFRLIGDMTIKQFGYLAGGAIAAYVFYKLPLPFFFSWPLAFVAAIAGVGFAFVPIEDRPMDIWVLSFLKNVYSPTQFVWSREVPTAPKNVHPTSTSPTVAPQPTRPQPAPSTASSQPAQTAAPRPVADVLQNIYTPGKMAQAPVGSPPPTAAPSPRIMTATRTRPPGLFGWFSALFSPKIKPTPPAPAVATPVPTPSVTGSHMDLTPPPKIAQPPKKQESIKADAVEKKQKELDEKAHKLEEALEETSQTSARVLELQKQLTEVLGERDRMRKELDALRVQHAGQPPVASLPNKPSVSGAPQTPPATRTAQQPTVRIITPEGAIKAGLPRLTTFPNVVTGVVRDADNALLPGVLVTVRDKDGVPVRALKTNRLGQFAASTPIANGTYLVEIEDPRGRYVFDRVQVTLNGSIVPALEIFAKSQKQVAREKLAKEIFGS